MVREGAAGHFRSRADASPQLFLWGFRRNESRCFEALPAKVKTGVHSKGNSQDRNEGRTQIACRAQTKSQENPKRDRHIDPAEIIGGACDKRLRYWAINEHSDAQFVS